MVIEYSFTDNWSADREYNYLDFGGRACATDTTGFFALDTSIRERIHVAKAGINYRFGGRGRRHLLSDAIAHASGGDRAEHA
jgi:hypothetical protein